MQMQCVPRPPSLGSVQKAIRYATRKPGSAVRLLTLDNGTQRAAVLYRAESHGRVCPHYYDVELGRASPIGEYANLGKGRVVSSMPYDKSVYEAGVRGFKEYEVLLSGGTVWGGPGKTG